MDISTGSASTVIAQMLSGSRLQQDHQLAVLKLANDQTRQNGENAMKLVESIPKPSSDGSLGTRFDAMA